MNSCGFKISPDLLKILSNEEQARASCITTRADANIDQLLIDNGDEIETWKLGLLRFGNQLPAVCYAYGISLKSLQHKFPEIFSARYHYDNVKGPSWPTYENFVSENYKDIDKDILDEILNQDRWEWYDIEKVQRDRYEGHYNQYFFGCTIDNQINFIKEQYQRIPKKILDIGGGRGEVANVFNKLGSICVSIDPAQHSSMLFERTGKLFFGDKFIPTSPLSIDLDTFTEKFDLYQFDTIIFCESIEHCSESEFWRFWQKVKSRFKGLIIIVNWIYYHPIPVSLPEHIFEINDKVYDCLVGDSKRCVYRNHSHLVLEF